MSHRPMIVWALVVLGAFLLGATGAPGQVAAAATDWLASNGHVRLVGPVGEAVREML